MTLFEDTIQARPFSFKETISENWQSTPLECHHLRNYCYLRKPNGKVGGIHIQSLATAVGR